MKKEKLQNIAEILSGTYQHEMPNGDFLYLQVKDFTSEHLLNGELKPSIPEEDKITKHMLINNDLLFAAKGTSNFCAIYKNEMGKAIASSAFFVIRPDSGIILPEYLCWYINIPQVMKRLQANAVGSTIPSITQKMLKDIDLYIPPFEVQNKIIAFVQLQEKEYNLRIQLAEKKNQLYNRLLMNIIKTI
jgi:restriction endonuclease S subunit